MISVVLPVFNEEKNIDELFSRISHVLNNENHEIIFVNDGSSDGTLEKIRTYSKQHKHVHFISFTRNFGHQIALFAGMEHAQGEVIVVLDSDLQDPPELITEMIKKQKEGYSIVYARRKSRAGEPFFKNLIVRLFYRILNKLVPFEIPVDTGDFRLVSKKVVETIQKMPEQNKYLRGQIAWTGFSSTTVFYDRPARKAGKSGYSFSKLARLALDGVFSFSDFPLRLATFFGFFVSFIAFGLICYAFISKWLWADTISGWSSLMVSTMFIGGVQMICIGIIGEYIQRIASDVRQRPLYVVQETDQNS